MATDRRSFIGNVLGGLAVAGTGVALKANAETPPEVGMTNAVHEFKPSREWILGRRCHELELRTAAAEGHLKREMERNYELEVENLKYRNTVIVRFTDGD